MAPVVFYLSNVAGFTKPTTFNLVTGLVATQEMLAVAPEVEALPMEAVLLVLTIVVLAIREYLQSESISPSSRPSPKVYISTDPHPLTADRLRNFLQRLQTRSQLYMILTHPSIKLPHPKLYNILSCFLIDLHSHFRILYP
jgi:hypothetical protein